MRNKKQKIRHRYISILIFPLILFVTACDQSLTPTASEDADLYKSNLNTISGVHDDVKSKGAVAAQLAEVRRLTASYHDNTKAEAAGYLPTDDCVELTGVGAMGYHFVNPLFFGPPEALDISKPQAILYEPQKNGNLRLVAVEYITGFGQPDISAPMLFGEHFHWNPVQGFWALHVWLWRHNPLGMFADWNPNVNCDYAP
ncbi:MAG: hypothetical protein ACFCU6_03820 [Balneolaceae bacterium]